MISLIILNWMKHHPLLSDLETNRCRWTNVKINIFHDSLRKLTFFSVSKFKEADCKPRNTVIPLNVTDSKNGSYFPCCIEVPRCGGCSLLSYKSCQPTEAEEIQVKVYLF